MTDAETRLNKALEESGYIIGMWCDGPLPIPQIGSVHEDWAFLRGPVVVVGYADADQYMLQVRRYGSPNGIERAVKAIQAGNVLAYCKLAAE